MQVGCYGSFYAADGHALALAGGQGQRQRSIEDAVLAAEEQLSVGVEDVVGSDKCSWAGFPLLLVVAYPFGGEVGCRHSLASAEADHSVAEMGFHSLLVPSASLASEHFEDIEQVHFHMAPLDSRGGTRLRRAAKFWASPTLAAMVINSGGRGVLQDFQREFGQGVEGGEPSHCAEREGQVQGKGEMLIVQVAVGEPPVAASLASLVVYSCVGVPTGLHGAEVVAGGDAPRRPPR